MKQITQIFLEGESLTNKNMPADMIPAAWFIPSSVLVFAFNSYCNKRRDIARLFE